MFHITIILCIFFFLYKILHFIYVLRRNEKNPLSKCSRAHSAESNCQKKFVNGSILFWLGAVVSFRRWVLIFWSEIGVIRFNTRSVRVHSHGGFLEGKKRILLKVHKRKVCCSHVKKKKTSCVFSPKKKQWWNNNGKMKSFQCLLCPRAHGHVSSPPDDCAGRRENPTGRPLEPGNRSCPRLA